MVEMNLIETGATPAPSPYNALEELKLNQDTILGFIIDRIQRWQSTMAPFFNEFEEYASSYRLLDADPLGGNRPSAFSRTRVGETIRSTEALTTSMFRMLTSQDPNFDVINLNGSQKQEQVYATSLQLRHQDVMLKTRRNLLRATRGVTLFGTQIVEEPWITKKNPKGQILYEGLGFVPRSLIQCAFDPNCLMLEMTPWIAFLDYYTKDQLEDMALADPQHWDPAGIAAAVEGAQGGGKTSSYLQQRRQKSGYSETATFEVATYYGRVKDFANPDGRYWCVRVINEAYPISCYSNPHPLGKLPFLSAKYLDFELESYGYGVGRLGRIAQRHMDENRRQYMDIARMSLMNMWIRDRLSGVKTSDLKIKPLGIIDADDVNLIKPFSPDPAGVTMGLKMEEIYRGEFQGNTGATLNLQAGVTDASATEASIAQNEAIRRVSVTAEDIGDSFIREYQLDKHAYNMEYLESDLWLAVTGMEKPVRVNRTTIAPEIDIAIRITTDKDFRPKRIENLLKTLNAATSIRNEQNILVDTTEIWKEVIAALDVNPNKVIRTEDNLSPATVLNFLMKARANAKQAAQEMGPEVAADGGDGGAAMMDTPAGPVSVSANG